MYVADELIDPAQDQELSPEELRKLKARGPVADPSQLAPFEGPQFSPVSDAMRAQVPSGPPQPPPPELDTPEAHGPMEAPPALDTPGPPPAPIPHPDTATMANPSGALIQRGPQQGPPPLNTPGQPPPDPNAVPKSGLLRMIGGALAGRFLGPEVQGQIERPGYGQKQAEAARQQKIAESKSKMGLEDAQAAHWNAAANDVNAQSKKPYMAVAAGSGLFNTKTGQWEKQPTDKATVQPLTKAQAEAVNLAPFADGTYGIPINSVGDYLKNQADKPVKTLQELAAQVVSDDSMAPPQKQAKLEEIRNAYNMLNPDKPVIHWAEGKDGTVTAVTATPGGVAAAGGAKSFGQIGKPQAPPMPGINLTPEAVQFWGQAAGQGVPLPSMGMGAAGAKAREQIINAAPGAGGGGPLAANRAVQRADTTSLGAMTKMRDGVVAFENTAKANLDVFVGMAQKAVDSGSPWVNTPLRSVNRNGLGSADLAAFDAARQVALTEIAKVVNNPSLSSVLSDSARKEVTSLIPENATLKQIYSVVKVLNQDMQNRHKYLNQGIADINKRMGGGGNGGSGNPDAPKVGAIQSHAGANYKFDGKQWVRQ